MRSRERVSVPLLRTSNPRWRAAEVQQVGRPILRLWTGRCAGRNRLNREAPQAHFERLRPTDLRLEVLWRAPLKMRYLERSIEFDF